MEYYYKYKDNEIELTQYIYKTGSYHYNWHKDLELLVVLNGKLEVTTNGKSWLLGKDNLILINSNMGHATLSKEADTIAMVLHIEEKFINKYFDDIDYLYFNCVSNDKNKYNKTFMDIRRNLSNMMISSMSHEANDRILFKSCVYSLLYTLTTEFPPKEIRNKTLKNRTDLLIVMDKIVKYIDKNYKNKISLDDLASLTSYNRNYLSTLIKQNLGINFYEYLSRIRLREATLDLTRLDIPISKIAFNNGFQDIKSFNVAFKEQFGKTPTEYRNEINQHIIENDKSFKKQFLSFEDEIPNLKLKEYSNQKSNDNFIEKFEIEKNNLKMELNKVKFELKEIVDKMEKLSN